MRPALQEWQAPGVRRERREMAEARKEVDFSKMENIFLAASEPNQVILAASFGQEMLEHAVRKNRLRLAERLALLEVGSPPKGEVVTYAPTLSVF